MKGKNSKNEKKDMKKKKVGLPKGKAPKGGYVKDTDNDKM